MQIFTKQLHPLEKDLILAQDGEEAKYTMFFVIWSLKEAFVKAIGQGLGFDLHELYFTVQYENGPMAGKSHHINTESLKDCTPLEITSQSEFLYGTAKATWNGQLRHDWSFRFQSLDVSHLFHSRTRAPRVQYPEL